MRARAGDGPIALPTDAAAATTDAVISTICAASAAFAGAEPTEARVSHLPQVPRYDPRPFAQIQEDVGGRGLGSHAGRSASVLGRHAGPADAAEEPRVLWRDS